MNLTVMSKHVMKTQQNHTRIIILKEAEGRIDVSIFRISDLLVNHYQHKLTVLSLHCVQSNVII